MKQFVFKRDPSFVNEGELILKYFEDLLLDKRPGSWLVRESRKEGLITVSALRAGVVYHCRFIYTPGGWRRLSSLGEDEQVSWTKVNLANMGNKAEELLAVIQGDLQLPMAQLQLPSSKNASEASAYINYIASEGREEPSLTRFANPLGALKDIKKLLSDEIDSIPLDVYLNNEDWLYYRPRFIAFLEASAFKDDLTCPISLEIFRAPYRLSSTHVIDKSPSTFAEDGTCRLIECPLSRTPQNGEPQRVVGYRTVFEQCLELFALREKLQWLQAYSESSSSSSVVSEVSMFCQSASSSEDEADIIKHPINHSG